MVACVLKDLNICSLAEKENTAAAGLEQFECRSHCRDQRVKIGLSMTEE